MSLMQKGKNVLLGMVGLILIMSTVPVEAAMVQKEITVTTGIRIYVDDVKLNPVDANGQPVVTFMYNGTTYLPVRAISNAVGREVLWDSATKSVYLGAQKASEPVEEENNWVGRYDEYLINNNTIFSADTYKKEFIPYLELYKDGTYQYNTNWFIGMALLSGTWTVDQDNPDLIHLSKAKGISHEITFEKITDKQLMLRVKDYVRDNSERSTSKNGDVYLKNVPNTDTNMKKKITVTAGVRVYVDNIELKTVDANGKPVESFIYNGTTYLPVRAIANAVGKDIFWDSKTSSVYLGGSKADEANQIHILDDGSLYYNDKNYNLEYEDRADLNMDGKSDHVQIFFAYDPYGRYDSILKINDSMKVIWGDDLEPEFKFTDIDKSDRFMEVAVSEYGPSDDPKTTFFQYDGHEIREIGSIEGFYGKYPGYTYDIWGSVIIDGSGVIKTLTRGKVLHTWFYEDEYILNKKLTLEQVPKDLYSMDAEVTVLRDFTLKKSRTDQSNGITLKAGESVTIKKTDNERWFSVMNKNGEIGWFEITEYDKIKDLGLGAGQVFEGLNYAD